MYRKEDEAAISAQIRRRWRTVAIPLVLLLAGIIVSIVYRLEAVTMVLTCLWAATLIFCYDLLIKPLLCYRRHLRNCLYGRTRTLDAAFGGFGEEIDLVDGVRYIPMTAWIQDEKGRDADRLFYFDCELPRPDWSSGQLLHITYHDRELVDAVPLD